MKLDELLDAQHRTVTALLRELRGEADIAKYAGLVRRVSEELVAHLAAEEAVLYPAARRALAEGDGRIAASLADHDAIRAELRGVLDAFERIDEDGAAPLGARLDALERSFVAHAREEEDEVMPLLVERIEERELEVLGAEMRSTRPPVWVTEDDDAVALRASGGWALRSAGATPLPPRTP